MPQKGFETVSMVSVLPFVWLKEKGGKMFETNKELESADAEPDEQNRKALVAPLSSAYVR